MINSDLTYKTAEQQDDYIQKLSIQELRTSFAGKSIFTKNVNKNITIVDNSTEKDREIQNLQINELRNFVNTAKHKQEKYTIQDKVKQTGLDENTILLIERNKYKATLEQLISYCKGLRISYKLFLPELY